ncbi:hypothetical protein ACR6C2_39505 [Streptomyces sp. INA 01156]
MPVHYGTYWPIGMDAVRPHEFHSPGDEFVRWAAEQAPGCRCTGWARRAAPSGGPTVTLPAALVQAAGAPVSALASTAARSWCSPRRRRWLRCPPSRRSGIPRCSCWC